MPLHLLTTPGPQQVYDPDKSYGNYSIYSGENEAAAAAAAAKKRACA